MMQMRLADGRESLAQWDTGRFLTVPDGISQVHFANKIYGRTEDVDVIDGQAQIPDYMLQSTNDLLAFGFVGTPENGYTKISRTFKVEKRPKPADYVFTKPDQTTLQGIIDRIEVLEKNPTQGEETDPTVPEWAKQPQKPTYTAAEVGAQPSDFVVSVDGFKIADKTWSEVAEARKAGKRVRAAYMGNLYEYVGEGYDFSTFVHFKGDTVYEIQLPDWTQTVSVQHYAIAKKTDYLPNPYPLTFTGAANASYNGTQAVTVEIPKSGGGGAFSYVSVVAPEDATYITINEDADGNPLRFTEAYIAVTAARQSGTNAATFGIGLTDWVSSYNSRAFAYNFNLNVDAYRATAHVKVADGILETHVAEFSRVAANIDAVKPWDKTTHVIGRGAYGHNAAGAYRFCPAEYAVAIANQKDIPIVVDGAMHTVTVGTDSATTTPLAAGSILEVWYR